MNAALLLLPDFLLIALGVALARLPQFDAAFWTGLERLVYFVLFPALLFRSLAASPRGFEDAGMLAFAGVGFTLAGVALSALAHPLFRLPHATFAACFQCGFRFNTYVALAAAARIGGTDGIAAMSLLVGLLVPLVNVVAVSMLARGKGLDIVLAIARNPLVIACVLGLAWRALALPLPSVAGRVLELCGAAAVPLGLLAVGAGLKLARGTLPWMPLAYWHAVKLVAVPATALVLSRLLGLATLERQVAVALAAVSTAPSAYILAVQMRANGAAVSLLVSSGTLLAALTLPLWIVAAA